MSLIDLSAAIWPESTDARRRMPGVGGINYGNLLARNLQFAFVPAMGAEFVSGTILQNTAAGGVKTAIGPTGQYLIGAASNAAPQLYMPQSGASINAGQPWTIAARLVILSSALGSSDYALATTTTAGANSGTLDRSLGVALSGGNVTAKGYIYDGGVKTLASSVTFPYGVVNATHTIVVSCGAGALRIFVDGVYGGSLAVANNGYAGYPAQSYFNVLADTVMSGYGAELVLRAEGYAWGLTEAAAFAANSWQWAAKQTLPYLAASTLLLPTLSSVTYTPGTLTSSGYGVRVTAA